MTSIGHTWTAMVESVWSSQFRVSKVLYLVLYVVIICSIPCYGKKHKLKEISVSNNSSDTNQTEVIERLSRFFGIDKVPVKVFHKAPPQYMLDLYNSITELGGLMKRDSPYNADVIRSFPDRQWNQQMLFYYNVSYLKDSEKILAAEFHVFKMRPRPSSAELRETKPPHVIEIKVYEVLNPQDIYSVDGLKLIDAKRISSHLHGWLVFNVQKSVEKWVNGSTPNYGFLVTTTSTRGDHVNGSYIRFAQRKEHHDSKQPILVTYTDDGLQRHHNYISPTDEDYLQIKKDILKKERMRQFRNKDFKQAIRLLNERDRAELQNEHLQRLLGNSQPVASRSKREATTPSSEGTTKKNKKGKRKRKRGGRKKKKRLSKEERRKRRERRREQRRKLREQRKKAKLESETSESNNENDNANINNGNKGKRALDYFRYTRQRRNCARHQMYVDFDEIGWSGWIISPKGYNAYHCKGECPFPLGQSQKPTNHATVQSIVHALKVGKGVSTPCCVPNKLFSISLLYFDDDENVILKQYDDMVAASCGCH